MSAGIGLTDKLHWRPILGTWHCFKRSWRKGEKKSTYISLCGWNELPKAYGGGCCRPPPTLRC